MVVCVCVCACVHWNTYTSACVKVWGQLPWVDFLPQWVPGIKLSSSSLRVKQFYLRLTTPVVLCLFIFDSETKSHCVAMAVLKLGKLSMLSFNVFRSSWLCFCNTGIKGVCRCTWCSDLQVLWILNKCMQKDFIILMQYSETTCHLSIVLNASL